jgi:hypothetical protein
MEREPFLKYCVFNVKLGPWINDRGNDVVVMYFCAKELEVNIV